MKKYSNYGINFDIMEEYLSSKCRTQNIHPRYDS